MVQPNLLVLSSILLLGMNLAGCTDVGELERRLGPIGFSALYRTEGGDELRAALSGPVPIIAADGTIVTSYRLEVEGEHQKFTQYLNRSFVLVREDGPCGHAVLEGEGCDRMTLGWHVMGLPSHLGLDLLHGFPAKYSINGIDYEYLVKSDGPWTALEDVAGAQDPPVAARFVFDGEAAPLKFSHSGGPIYTRATMETTERLGVAEDGDLQLAEEDVLLSSDGRMMFPGEHTDPFALGYTFIQIVEAFQRQEDEAEDRLRRDGCVIRIHLYPLETDETPFAVANRDLAEFQLEILDSEQRSVFWKGKIDDTLGELEFKIEDRTERAHQFSCERDVQPYRLQTSFNEVVDLSSRIFSHQKGLLGGGFTAQQFWHWPVGTEYPYHKYLVQYKPPSVEPNSAYMPYGIHYEAGTDRLLQISLHPKDAREFDELMSTD